MTNEGREMAQPAYHRMSEDEFFVFVEERDGKWELVDGQPTMMAGANQRHQTIAMKTVASLHSKLRGSGCRTPAADTGVATVGGNLRYPDVVVDCGARNDQSMLATTPTVVIEVLSPSTSSFDSQRKLVEYKSNPNIRSILLIDTDNACTILHRREGRGWSEAVFSSVYDVVDLPEIDASLTLRDIYDGLELKPRLVVAPVCRVCVSTPCICGESSTFTP